MLFLAQYRKSFPSVSASFPSPYCDNSADDSNTSSPRSLRHATGPDRQPCYQFRKSNSMKLALKEDVEGDGLRLFIHIVRALIRCRRLMMLCYVFQIISICSFLAGRMIFTVTRCLFHMWRYHLQLFLFRSFSGTMQVILCCFQCCVTSVCSLVYF